MVCICFFHGHLQVFTESKAPSLIEMREMGKSEGGLVAKNIFFIGPHFSESAPSIS